MDKMNILGGLGRFIVLLSVAALLAVIVLEVFVGCGEPTYFQDHTWVTGECLFAPHTVTTGHW
jgi:hypothetical protein